MSQACATPGCPFLAHTDAKIQPFCCYACVEEGDHGPRCQRRRRDYVRYLNAKKSTTSSPIKPVVRTSWEKMRPIWAGQPPGELGSASSSTSPPLDAPPRQLYLQLEPKRTDMARYVKLQLTEYDGSAFFPRTQDELHGCRDGYDVHVRCKAVKEIRKVLTNRECSIPKVTIIGLMAVHIASKKRLNKLRHALKSIQEQDLSSCDAEFVLAIGWHASSPEFEAPVQELLDQLAKARAGPDGTGALTVLVRHEERQSQFQHVGAALHSAEVELQQRWGFRDGDQQGHSIWTIFGDDDDIWHPQRVAEYARVIKRHPLLDGVAAFVTTSRVDVKVPEEGGQVIDEVEVPQNAAEVEMFVLNKKGHRLNMTEACREWADALKAAGADAALLPAREDMSMEYFNFCPRLRIVHEFFHATSPKVIAHRYCDLRFMEFMMTYPYMGLEAGLELAWFDASGWMYFYSNVGLAYEDFKRNYETDEDGQDTSPMLLGAERGHVSTTVSLEDVDIQLADEHFEEMQVNDESLTRSRLARYIAGFRSNMEMDIVRRHTRTMDQRVFDYIVYCWVVNSFGVYVEKIHKDSPKMKCSAAKQLFMLCQKIAKDLAEEFDVKVVWHMPDRFITPEITEWDDNEKGADTNSNWAANKTPYYAYREEPSLNKVIAGPSPHVHQTMPGYQYHPWAKHY